MPKTAASKVEMRHLQTSYVVLHPEAGLVTTENYAEAAYERGLELVAKHGGKAFIIEAAKIQRLDPDGRLTRLYKLERDRLDIQQALL